MDCTITVTGMDRRKPSNVQSTGTVRRFIVDNNKCYASVFKHVTKCENCNAEEVLQAYLAHRTGKAEKRSHGGTMTDSLIELALSYEKARPVQVKPSTVNEFLLRAYNISLPLKYWKRFTSEEMVRYTRFFIETVKRENARTKSSHHTAGLWIGMAAQDLLSPLGILLKAAATIHDAGGELPEDSTDLINLAEVAYVMAS